LTFCCRYFAVDVVVTWFNQVGRNKRMLICL
jgi:hypothetical protein